MHEDRRRGPFAGTPRELQQVLAAERAGDPFLQWRAPDGQLSVLALEDGRARVMIGRAPECDVPLAEDPEVSRTHAVLERFGGEWTLIDDGLSRNGSFVNATRVLGRQRLADGDRVCVGATELIYRAGREPAVAPTQSARESQAAVTLSPMQRRVVIALCRPVHDSESATPATNREIANEVFLSQDAVKAHLRVLFERFGLSELPQNEKRGRLVATVLVSGLIQPREF
jgi:pSer/pThr/pTyr-binding forkhead associated (FHA) protein